VTPADYEFDDSDVTNDSYAEDDENVLDSDDDDNILDSNDDDSLVSSAHSERLQLPMIGNRLVNFPLRSLSLQTVTACKECILTNMLSFVDFCVRQTKTLYMAADEKKTYKREIYVTKKKQQHQGVVQGMEVGTYAMPQVPHANS
jgi:hypothetical protein